METNGSPGARPAAHRPAPSGRPAPPPLPAPATRQAPRGKKLGARRHVGDHPANAERSGTGGTTHHRGQRARRMGVATTDGGEARRERSSSAPTSACWIKVTRWPCCCSCQAIASNARRWLRKEAQLPQCVIGAPGGHQQADSCSSRACRSPARSAEPVQKQAMRSISTSKWLTTARCCVRLQHAGRLPHQIGAQADRPAASDAIADTAGSDQRRVRAGSQHRQQCLRRGYAPSAKASAMACWLASAARAASTAAWSGAAGTGHHRWRPPRHRPVAGPPPRIFPRRLPDHHGTGRRAASADRLQHAAPPVPISTGLHGLLQRVEVHDQRVVDHLHRPPRLVHAIAPNQLGGAEVGQQQDVRCQLAQLAGEALIAGGFQRYPLRTHGHRNAQLLGGLGQMRIDRRRARRATGHGADQRGARRRPNSAVCRSIWSRCNSGRAQCSKRKAPKPVPVARDGAGGAEDDVQMIVLAADQRLLAHGNRLPGRLPLDVKP